jgi:hypothetical protein
MRTGLGGGGKVAKLDPRHLSRQLAAHFSWQDQFWFNIS